MRKKLEAFLYRHLPLDSFVSDDEKYLHLVSLAACMYAVSMQFIVFLFYLANRIVSLFFLYFGGFLLDILLFRFVHKRRYMLFGLLLSAIVIVETLASAICIGTNSFVIVYLFVTLMMQILIPYASVRVRALVVAALWGSMVALVLINHYMTPITDIGKANTALAFFYIHLAFFGVIIQLTIGNTIRGVIAEDNRKKLEESQTNANTDPLTGLFNRRYADIFFRKLIAGQLEQLWCVAMLDIDDFKQINDTNGHQIGDEVLMLVSNYVTTSLRRGDLVFRWGGEELLILLKDVDVDTAFLTLDKLRGKIEAQSFKVQGKPLDITVTIGVSPLDIEHVMQSIDISDRLMYIGKAMGKNRVVR